MANQELISPGFILRSSENYVEIAKALIGKENHHSLRNSIHLCLLNASICQLCNPDVADRTTKLMHIQALDDTFQGTPEFTFVTALETALLERDLVQFIHAIHEFNIAPMVAWKAITLSMLMPYLLNNI